MPKSCNWHRAAVSQGLATVPPAREGASHVKSKKPGDPKKGMGVSLQMGAKDALCAIAAQLNKLAG